MKENEKKIKKNKGNREEAMKIINTRTKMDYVIRKGKGGEGRGRKRKGGEERGREGKEEKQRGGGGKKTRR